MRNSALLRTVSRTLFAATVLLSLAGCKTEYDRAVEKAKADAVATGQSQQVISVDKAGNTTTTVVLPPSNAGQQPVVSTAITPPGTTMPPGQPDYSNGARPAPGNTVTFIGPRAPSRTANAPPAANYANTPSPAAPAIGTTPSLEPSNGTATAPVTADAGDASTAFVPTDVTIPAGTGIAIRMNQTISAKQSHAGERFTGSLAESVSRNGNVVLPRGSRFNGIVTEAHRRGHFKGRSYLGLRLTSLVYQGKTYPLATARFLQTKKGKGKRSSAFIGAGTGLGMIAGGLAAGGVGLGVGAAAGGGLGTLLAGVTGNRDITIPAESVVRFRLEDNLTVQPAE